MAEKLAELDAEDFAAREAAEAWIGERNPRRRSERVVARHPQQAESTLLLVHSPGLLGDRAYLAELLRFVEGEDEERVRRSLARLDGGR